MTTNRTGGPDPEGLHRLLKSWRMAAVLLALGVLAIPSTAQRLDEHWVSVLGTSVGGLLPGSVTPSVAAMDASGNLYIAFNIGYYATPGGVSVLARYDAAAGQWSVLGDHIGYGVGGHLGGVKGLVVHPSGDLFVAGNFFEAVNTDGSTLPVGGIIRWDAAAQEWDNLSGGLAGAAYSIALTVGGDVCVGGSFTAPAGGGPDLNNVGCWNGNGWTTLGGGVGAAANYPAVQSISIDPSGDIVAAGSFTESANVAGGATTPRNYIARWDGSSWHDLGDGLAGYIITGILTDAARTYVFGHDVEANTGGGTVTADILAWDGNLWSAFDGGIAADAIVHLVRTDTGVLYAAANRDVYRLRPTDAQWTAIGAIPNPEYLLTIAARPSGGDDLYVGGSFTEIADPAAAPVQASGHVVWDGSQWVAPVSLPNVGSGFDDGVLAIAADRPSFATRIVAGGTFRRAGFVSAERIAVFDGTTWGAMGIGVTAPSDAAVLAVAFDPDPRPVPDRVFVGGFFDEVMGSDFAPVPAHNIAVYDFGADAWSTLGQGLNGPVHSVLPWINPPQTGPPDYLYVGGAFTEARNGDGSVVPAGGVVRWNFASSSWEALGEGISGGGATVYALAVGRGFAPHNLATPDDHDVFVGGDFTMATNPGGGAVAADNLARWSADHLTWSPVGQGTNGPVRALAYLRGRKSFLLEGDFPYSILYAGGDFTAVRNGSGANVIADHIAKWYSDSDTWDILGRDFSGNGVNAPVHSLAFHGPYTNATWLSSASLVVAGEFTEAIGRDGATVTANHIAILTDPFPLYNHESISNIAYTPLGPMALDDVAHAAAVIHCGGRGETIYAGGEFLRAGLRASPYMAKWHYEPPAPVQAVVINSSPRCTSRCGAIVVAPAPRTCAPGLEKSGADFPLFDDAGFLDRIEVTGLPIGQPFDIDLHDAGHPGNVIDRIDSVVVETVSPGLIVLMGVDDPGEYAPNPDGLDTGTRAVVVPIPEIPDPSLAVVRFIHAVTDAPAVDVVLDGEVIAAGVAYGETALPAVAPAGEHTIEIRRSSDNELLDTQTVELEPGYRTIVFGGFLDPSANQNGPAAALSEHSAEVSTAAEPSYPPELPQDAITLSAPYPNPLRTRASVILAMGEHRRVTVELYDVQGRRVGTLHDGFLPAGRHELSLDASGLPSGVYFVSVDGSVHHPVRKVVVVR